VKGFPLSQGGLSEGVGIGEYFPYLLSQRKGKRGKRFLLPKKRVRISEKSKDVEDSSPPQ